MAYSITAEEVAGRLGGAKQGPDGSMYCRCPCHDDAKASLWIKQRDGGGLFVKCHAGCSRETVEAALKGAKLWPQTGARKQDNSAERRRNREGATIERFVAPVPPDAPAIDWAKWRRPNPTCLYEYRDSAGDLMSMVARWDSTTGEKELRPVSFARLHSGRMEWVLAAPPPPHTLYNLDQLTLDDQSAVLIVEGEKAADAAARLFPDRVVVTWRGGANASDKTDFTPLKDRDVVLWPDADDPGRAVMSRLAGRLTRLGSASVHIAEVPETFPKGWDLADPSPPEFDVRAAIETAEPASAPPDQDGAKPLSLTSFLLAARDLLKLELPERDWLIDRLISTSSLSMVYADRGLGKTWFVLSLALAAVKGENFLDYEVNRPWRVLYVDGEMPLVDLQTRIRALEPDVPPTFVLLPSERLFREAEPLNLHSPEDQERLVAALDDLAAADAKPDLIIFDNLSSLSGGVDENDNSALDGLLRWLVKLKHRGFAVLLVHHAGKSGAQRGASRREDLLDTSMLLAPPGDDDEPHDGASFTLLFPKTRGRRPKPAMLEMRLIDHEGHLTWAFNEPKKIDRRTELLRLAWEHRPKTQKELAGLIGLSEASVSGYCKRLRRAGLLEPEGLTLTLPGRDALVAAYPELEPQMLQQGELLSAAVI